MKKIEEMTIPEMVDRYLDCQLREYSEDDGNTDLSDVRGEITALSRALDVKCEEAGIKLWADGVVSFTKLGDKNEFFVCPKIYAPDLHALLGYLLEKQK